MSAPQFKDLALSTLAASLAAIDTSFNVATGEGNNFSGLAANQHFYIRVGTSSFSRWEIMGVTARSGDAFTVTRNVASSTGAAQAFDAGDQVVQVVPASEFGAFAVVAAESELTIASGRVTPHGLSHTIDTEGNAAADDLATIVTTNIPDGGLLLLRAENASRVPTIKHEAGGAGQIHLFGESDINLGDTSTVLILQRRGDDFYQIVSLAATESTAGIVELATAAEAAAGTDTGRVITAAVLAALWQYGTIGADAGAMRASDTNGAESDTRVFALNGVNRDIFGFDGSVTEYVEFSCPMPEDWAGGKLKAKIGWTNESGASVGDKVEWAIQSRCLGDGDAIDAAWGAAVVISDTLKADGAEHITAATPAMTCAGTPAGGKDVQFRVYRNVSGTDDMTEDAQLLNVAIQYKRGVIVAAW